MSFAYLLQQSLWFFGLGAVFWMLSLKWGVVRSGPPRNAVPDVIYWFIFPVLYGAIQGLMLTAGFWTMFAGNLHAAEQYFATGVPALRALPMWAQAILVLLITDFYMYWVHRLFHRGRLWRFHAVHHAPTRVDWLTCVRFHPVNVAAYATMANVLTIMMGFSPAVLVFLGPFNVIWSGLVHANLNWDFGPFRYVLASPVFHRWHHSDVVMDKNFAATFPVLDLLFGTFYMPKGELPLTTGTPHDPVPDTLWGQLIYPFFPGMFKSPRQELPTHG